MPTVRPPLPAYAREPKPYIQRFRDTRVSVIPHCDTVGLMNTSDTGASGDTVKMFTGQVSMTLRLEAELHDRIRVCAAHERKPMAQWIREALELVVDRVEQSRA